VEPDLRCELCRAAATHVLNKDGVGPDAPLCDKHYRYVEDTATSDRQRSASDRVLGYGRSSGLPGDHGLTCDKCSATWTGIGGGELCPWCHVNYVRQLRYQRENLLRPNLDVEPDDKRYRALVDAHSTRLVKAVQIRLITGDEARRARAALLRKSEEVAS
jgi:hypothetical protein